MSTRAVRDRLLRRSPLQAVFRRRNLDRLAVLAYHAVPDADAFEAHVRHLQATAHPIALRDLLDTGRALPPRAVLVTFDDGDPTIAEVAAPILGRHGVPAVAFVVTDVVGTADPLWWREVEVLAGREAVPPLKRLPDRERRARLAELRRRAGGAPTHQRQLGVEDLRGLEAHGIEVGSHSASHPCLDRAQDEVVRAELERSREALAGWLGHPPRAFAYPNGDHDDRVRRLVAEAGYEVAFAFDHRLSDVPPADPLAVSRLRVDVGATVDRLDLLLSGLHSAVHHRLGRA